jgi:hypothetical protein
LRVGVGGAVKQKSVEAPNIEIELEDCKEYTTTLSFYEPKFRPPHDNGRRHLREKV